MDLGLDGRCAVVCASTSGLGEAVARALAAEGARVVVSGRRGDRARAVAADLPRAVGVEVDITGSDGPDRLLSAAAEAFGPPDILVLNGPGPEPGLAAGLRSQDLVQAMALLLLPQHRLVSMALPGMRRRGWGRVLAVGSLGVIEPLDNLALSNIGRAALAGYLKTLSAEVGRDGVTVNLLIPGRISTDRLAALDNAKATREGISKKEVASRSQSKIPMGRYGRPAEFGAIAAFVCSEAASYVTGAAIRCDGGLASSL